MNVFSSSIIDDGIPLTPQCYSIVINCSLVTIFHYFLQTSPPTAPTINVLGRFVGIVLYNHLDEVHALYNETFKGHALPSRSEDVADSKLQRTMDEWYKCTWVVLQEI